jgi:hypothetical protein
MLSPGRYRLGGIEQGAPMQPYPSAPPPEPYQPGPGQPQPRSVQTAVRLMYAGATLNAIGVILGLVTVGSLKADIIKRSPNLTPTQVHGVEVFGIIGTVLIGLIAIGLWIWMAWANGKGRSWARIVSAVLFGIDTLNLLLSFARANVAAALILGFLVWLAGLGAIIMIFNKESAPFYRRPSGQN